MPNNHSLLSRNLGDFSLVVHMDCNWRQDNWLTYGLWQLNL